MCYVVSMMMSHLPHTRAPLLSLLTGLVLWLICASCSDDTVSPATPSAPIPGESWTVRQSPQGVNLFATASSGSRHIAVGFKGALVVSDSLDVWTNGPALGNNTLQAAAHSDLGFLVGSTSEDVRLSVDAVSWSAFETGLGQAVVSIHWLDTMFATVGETGGIALSVDGRHWQVAQIGEPMRALAHLSDNLMAVGLSSRVATSIDGVNWRLDRWESQQSSGDLMDVAADGYLAVAVGLGGTIATSADGRNWTNRRSPVREDLLAIAYSGERFVAVGKAGIIIYSDDGIVWHSSESPTDRHLNDIVWTGETFVAVGNGGTIITSP